MNFTHSYVMNSPIEYQSQNNVWKFLKCPWCHTISEQSQKNHRSPRNEKQRSWLGDVIRETQLFSPVIAEHRFKGFSECLRNITCPECFKYERFFLRCAKKGGTTDPENNGPITEKKSSRDCLSKSNFLFIRLPFYTLSCACDFFDYSKLLLNMYNHCFRGPIFFPQNQFLRKMPNLSGIEKKKQKIPLNTG